MRELCLLLLGLGLLSGSADHASAAFQAGQIIAAPELGDTDGDGLDDGLELQLGTDESLRDTDGDGWDDLSELVHGTDPCDPRDHPRATEADPGLTEEVRLTLRREAIRQSAWTLPPDRRPTTSGGVQSLRYYYLDGNMPDLAAELRMTSLPAGEYVLAWSHLIEHSPLDLRQHYVVRITRADGKVIGEWPTPAEVRTERSIAALSLSLTTEDVSQPMSFSVTPVATGLRYAIGDLMVLPAGLETDEDRDGIIASGERPPSGRPLRHWINDDDDHGEWQEKSDRPGLSPAEADHARPGIDGLRDLVDFIPLNLAIGSVVRRLRPEDGFSYRLRNDDRAVQAVVTGLTRATVGALHRNPALAVFGPSLDGARDSAEILRPDEQGCLDLPRSFLEHVAAAGHGVMLLEGARSTRKPLRLEICKEGELIVGLEMLLQVGPVESMYRQVDLTRLASTFAGKPLPSQSLPRPSFTFDPPALPDLENGQSWVVMIHGYNVSGQAARGWHAETFKRLRALGSKARFVGVTWNGDTGLDYHEAVFQAFQAGDALPAALRFVDPGRTTLVAHSLGNIVACQGVQAGFTPAHFFMLNAALPLEAIAGEAATAAHAADMTEAAWRPYPRRLYAADWSKLQVSGRQRHGYAWPNCFARIRHLDDVINCYSAGEDVTNCPPYVTDASVLAALWAGRAIDYGVWKTQELLKGVGWTRSLGSAAMARTQGGWGFNAAWRGRFRPSGPDRMLGGRFELLPPATAALIKDEQLRKDPFFFPFEQKALHAPATSPVSPLVDAPKVRYDLLARGLPALSPAAGSTPLPTMNGPGMASNYDLEAQGRLSHAGWPAEGHRSPLTQGRWLHSDYKNVALPYVYPLFTMMITRGGLR